jgi:predicted ferric reductase
LVGNYLSYPLERAIWIGYTAAWLTLLCYTRIIYPPKLIRNKFKVTALKEERGASWTVTLRSARNKPMLFKPGQFAWITLWKTPFSDTEHPFSFSSSSEKPDEISFTIKDLEKFTSTIKELKVGQDVYVDGPHGVFSMDRHPDTQKLIFIAGGIDITPIMSMLRSMADRHDQRPVKLFYNNRDWNSLTFREEIADLKKNLTCR